MIPKDVVADPNVQHAIAATAAATGLATWMTAVTNAALAIFGVPLQVVLAAATGAYAAGSFKEATTYWRAILTGTTWMAAGIFCAHLAQWLIGAVTGKDLPPGALAGAAFLVSSIGQLVMTKETIDKIRQAVQRVIDNFGAQK